MSGAAIAGPARPAADRSGVRIQSRNRPLMIAGAMAALVMQLIDTTIANVALPHMQASLGATTDTITWVLTSYVLASAVALPATGWLVDRVGLRKVFTASVAAFTVASILCGLAQSMTDMVLFRVLQGLAGAFLSPLAQTVLLDSSTEEERPKMMIIFSQGVLLGPIIGPLLGGYITESASWRWVFFINVPVGIVSILVLLATLPGQRGSPGKFDFTGWGLLAVAIASLQLLLDRGAGEDWFQSPEIVTYAALSASAFWLAGFRLATVPGAIFPRALFSDVNLVLCAFLTFIFGMVMMSVMALLPTLLQHIYGYPTIESGWLMIPRGIAMLVAMTLVGQYIARLDARLSLAVGLAIIGLSLWMMTYWTTEMPTSEIVVAGLVQGLGFCFVFMPLNILAFATLRGDLRTHATSLLNLLRNLGQSIGIAVCTVLLSRNIQINHAELGGRLTQYRFPINMDQVSSVGDAGQGALAVMDGIVSQQAAMIAYLNDFLFMAIVCWAVIPLVILIRKPASAVAPDAPPEVPH